jgi:hypothetical protein
MRAWQVRVRVVAALLATTALTFQGACGSDAGPGTAQDGGAGDGGDLDGAGPADDAGGRCTSAADCPGGVCITESGVCCDSVAHVCGSVCCGEGNVCLFDVCLTPGALCRSSNDCAENEYCEPALGVADAGIGDAGLPPGCSQPLPVEGRCLPLPPTCGADGGAPDGGLCIAPCEYHPPSGGMLNATAKWTWGPAAVEFPDVIDVWATPTVGRIRDSNCDGAIDALDSPVVVFVSGNTGTVNCNSGSNPDPQACHDGVLRVLDGRTGQEVWSLAKASTSSVGFMAGLSVALGDVTGDGFMDIVAMTGEGHIVVVDRDGTVEQTSDLPYGTVNVSTGWGGGLAIADMDLDGYPEIAYADTVWTMAGGTLHRAWVGGQGTGGAVNQALSVISDLDQAADGKLELLAGNTLYSAAGAVLWQNASVTNGFPGVGDFDGDGAPEAVVVGGGKVWILNGVSGAIELGPYTLPGTGGGGAPTVADFDGDGKPEIGVAQANYYSVLKPDYGTLTIGLLWQTGNHDYSSSVTGSTVFDFEGDGVAEVIYADECWLWVFDGPSGAVRLAWPHSSFTATEASIVADIDGDGHADMLIPSQGVSMTTWTCAEHQTTGTAINGQHWTPGPQANLSYRGLVAIGDAADSWVGTRTLWNQHGYHVTNVCDDTDDACAPPNRYGSIPTGERPNWTVPWLNNFRQNVQDQGIFNAPDAVVGLTVECVDPPIAHVAVRNLGQSGLPAGVVAAVFVTPGDVEVGRVTTARGLLAGQTELLEVTLAAPATSADNFYAAIIVDPLNPTFHQCRADNDRSDTVRAACMY